MLNSIIICEIRYNFFSWKKWKNEKINLEKKKIICRNYNSFETMFLNLLYGCKLISLYSYLQYVSSIM